MSVLEREFNLVKKMWGNGGRWVLIANAYFLAAVTIFVVVWLIAFVFDDDFSPLSSETPQRVIGVEDEGRTLVVEATKCNDTSKEVAVSGVIYIRNLQTNVVTFYRNGAALREPGCKTQVWRNPLPNLEPGEYQLEGIDEARKGEQIQQDPWRTEPFTIEGEHDE